MISGKPLKISTYLLIYNLPQFLNQRIIKFRLEELTFLRVKFQVQNLV